MGWGAQQGHRFNLVKLIKGGSSPVTMAQDTVQGQQSVQTYQEEMKIAKSMLIDLFKNVKKFYNKLTATGAFVGKHAEDGYWGTLERIEEAERSVKEALIKINEMLIELGVTPGAEEVEEEVEVEEKGRVVEKVYEVFNDLVDINNRVTFLMDYIISHKLFDFYKLDYARRALWSALLSLVDAIYYSC